MELMRLGPKGNETPVLKIDGRYFDISGVIGEIGPGLWARIDEVSQAQASGKLPELTDAENLRVGSPVATAGSIICIGQNYAAHAAESGAEPPTEPVIFFKSPNTITGPYDQVGIPPQSQKTDWEVELALVISKPASYLASNEEAAACIGGYMVANDLSEREFQIELSGGQWSKGKCFPDSMPLGPVLRTADEFDPHSVNLRSWVNGDKRQDSNTSDMIFTVEDIVRELSWFMRLEPGDIISTGTPEGVAFSGRFPYLKAGDTTDLEIEGLGAQKQTYFQVEVDTTRLESRGK